MVPRLKTCGCPISRYSCIHEQQEAAQSAGTLATEREVGARRAADNLAKGLCAHGYPAGARDAKGIRVCPGCAWIEAEGLDR